MVIEGRLPPSLAFFEAEQRLRLGAVAAQEGQRLEVSYRDGESGMHARLRPTKKH